MEQQRIKVNEVKHEIDITMVSYKINKISEAEKDRYLEHILNKFYRDVVGIALQPVQEPQVFSKRG